MAVSPDSSETPEADTVRLCYRAGYKQYALSNHLGNVLATVSDRVILEDTTGDDTADAHLADLLSAQDYYPFGMRMPGRAGRLYLNEVSGAVEFVLDETAEAAKRQNCFAKLRKRRPKPLRRVGNKISRRYVARVQ